MTPCTYLAKYLSNYLRTKVAIWISNRLLSDEGIAPFHQDDTFTQRSPSRAQPAKNLAHLHTGQTCCSNKVTLPWNFLIYTQGHESRRTSLCSAVPRPRDHARSGHTSAAGPSPLVAMSCRCDRTSAVLPTFLPLSVIRIPLVCPSNVHCVIGTRQ